MVSRGEPNGIRAQLVEVLRRLDRIEARLDQHDSQHHQAIEQSASKRIELERRITLLESKVQMRTGVGVLGIVAAYAMQLFGLGKQP